MLSQSTCVQQFQAPSGCFWLYRKSWTQISQHCTRLIPSACCKSSRTSANTLRTEPALHYPNSGASKPTHDTFDSQHKPHLLSQCKMLNKEKEWLILKDSIPPLVVAEQMSSASENWVPWNFGWHCVIRHLDAVAWYMAVQQLRDLKPANFFWASCSWKCRNS